MPAHWLHLVVSAEGVEQDYFKIIESRIFAAAIASTAANSDILTKSKLQVLEAPAWKRHIRTDHNSQLRGSDRWYGGSDGANVKDSALQMAFLCHSTKSSEEACASAILFQGSRDQSRICWQKQRSDAHH